jgi:hypothetical protein
MYGDSTAAAPRAAAPCTKWRRLNAPRSKSPQQAQGDGWDAESMIFAMGGSWMKSKQPV